MSTPISIALAAHDLTRDELAQRAGCSPAWMTEIVSGRRRPSDALAERIGDVLEVDPDDLFADDTDAVVIAFVRRTTAASGVPEALTDLATAETVATLLRGGS